MPFTSRFKLASGAKATKAQQQRVEGDCPQATVGLFGTPIDKVDDALFERAVTEFVSCMPARHDLLLERADRRVVRPAHDRSPSKQIAPLIA